MTEGVATEHKHKLMDFTGQNSWESVLLAAGAFEEHTPDPAVISLSNLGRLAACSIGFAGTVLQLELREGVRNIEHYQSATDLVGY